MIYLIWIISLIGAFYFGYQCKTIVKKVETLEEVVKTKIDKPSEQPESTFIDPLDPVAEAQYQRDKMMKELNG